MTQGMAVALLIFALAAAQVLGILWSVGAFTGRKEGDGGCRGGGRLAADEEYRRVRLMIAERIALHLPARLAGPFMDFARDCVPRDTPVSVGMLAREKDPGAAFYWLWHGQGMPQELYDGVRDLLPEKWEDYETGDREVAMARAYLRPGDAEVIDRAMAECGIKYSTFSTYNGHANGTRERPDFLLISAVLHRLPVRKAVAVVSGMGLPDTWVDLDEWRLRNV